jgi:hypothetical protein
LKVYCVVFLARQVDGELVNVKFDKAFKTPELALDYFRSMNYKPSERKVLPTDYGGIEFEINGSIYEFDVVE